MKLEELKNIGKKAWVIDETITPKVIEVSISSVECGFYSETQYIPLYYNTNTFLNFAYGGELTSKVPCQLVYFEEEYALVTKDARFFRIHLKPEEWESVIGDRDKESGLSNIELEPCCAKISSCRNILINTQCRSGITYRDFVELSQYLNEHNLPNDETPILKRIFETAQTFFGESE